MEKTIVIHPIYTLKLTTENVVIHIGRAKLLGVTISGDGANGDCDIYDGVNNLAEKKAHLEVLSGTSFNFIPSCGAYIERGIYVVVNASTTNVMVTYQPLGRKEAE